MSGSKLPDTLLKLFFCVMSYGLVSKPPDTDRHYGSVCAFKDRDIKPALLAKVKLVLFRHRSLFLERVSGEELVFASFEVSKHIVEAMVDVCCTNRFVFRRVCG